MSSLGVVWLIFAQRADNRVKQIQIDHIKPNKSQPRKNFSDEELRSLADSIRENGVLQPISVRKVNSNNYELIAGERRLRASSLLGLKIIPSIVLNCDDNQSAVFALIENLQRSDLDAFEEAEGIKLLIQKLNITQEEVAARIGKKQSTVANKLRLLKLDRDERTKILNSGLTERHARALLRIKDKKIRDMALDRIISKEMNVQQSDKMIDSIINDNKKQESKNNNKYIIKDIRIFTNTLDKAVETMKNCGINVIIAKKSNEDYIEYTIKIEKKI